MKLNYILLFFLLISFQDHFAQEGKADNKEKIAALRVGFISQKLNLTSQEGQSFWPLYNEYQQKRENLRNEHLQTRGRGKQNIDEMTDKEAEAFIDAEINYKQKDLDLQKELHKKLKAILSAKKIALLYRAEQQFNKKLLEAAIEDTPKRGKR